MFDWKLAVQYWQKLTVIPQALQKSLQVAAVECYVMDANQIADGDKLTAVCRYSRDDKTSKSASSSKVSPQLSMLQIYILT